MTQIVGVVSDRLWPLLPLAVSGMRGTLWALVDTGFEGSLMVPESERQRLRLVRTSLMASGVNADGTSSLVSVGRVTLDWLGATITVRTHVPSTTMIDGEMHYRSPIVGMIGLHLLQGLRLSFDLYPGRPVIVEQAR
ncbi:MAG: hypothetical protein ACT4N2_14105 [Hyphomicrobium sp.]